MNVEDLTHLLVFDGGETIELIYPQIGECSKITYQWQTVVAVCRSATEFLAVGVQHRSFVYGHNPSYEKHLGLGRKLPTRPCRVSPDPVPGLMLLGRRSPKDRNMRIPTGNR